MKQMRKQTILATALIGAFCAGAGAEAKVERSPLEIGTTIDIGQIVKGERTEDEGLDIDKQMIQRTGVSLNQNTTVNDRLTIKVGVGGLFFYTTPEQRDDPLTRTVRFGPGISQAQGIYNFGDLANPFLTLQFGYFPYKYNPDAKNLGEYLLRSGAYPGYEITGGWSIINSAAYMASGLRAGTSLLDGKLKADLNLFMEHDLEPLYDLSPSLILDYQPHPVFEVGAGVQFSHLIPAASRKLKSRSIFYKEAYTDSLGVSHPDTLSDDPTDPSAKAFTFQAIKLMARASVNLGALLNNPWIGKEGLKFYSEVAVLGVKDYPVFYDDISQRIPLLVGVNLPTLKFFDVLSVEMEYRKWGYPNDITKMFDGTEPIYTTPESRTITNPTPILDSNGVQTGTHYDTAFVTDQNFYDPAHPTYWLTYTDNGTPVHEKKSASDANIKWTVYAKKQLMQGISFYAQAASDQMRTIRTRGGGDLSFSRRTVTQSPDEWYYLIRLEFGI